MKAEVRLASLLALTLLLGGCSAPPATVSGGRESNLTAFIDLMLRAEQARGEARGDLLRLLERAAVMRPSPHSRARLALALVQGDATRAELDRAGVLLSRLLDGPAWETAQDGALATLLAQQRAVVARRVRERDARQDIESRLAALDARHAADLRLHARTRRERDGALDRLEDARRRLRAIADIELGAPSGGG